MLPHHQLQLSQSFVTVFCAVPDVVFPNVGPATVSVITLPAISVPVIVKLVDDKSPPSDRIDIVPFNEEWVVGVPREVPEVTEAFEKSESLSVVAPDSHWPNWITILPEPVEEVGKEKPVNSSVCDVAREEILISEENALAFDGELIDKDAAVLVLM